MNIYIAVEKASLLSGSSGFLSISLVQDDLRSHTFSTSKVMDLLHLCQSDKGKISSCFHLHLKL